MKYEAVGIFTAPDGEMKALLALPLVLLAAASVLAYGNGDAAGGFAFAMSEPAYMLLSGTILIAIAGAVRRFSL